MAAAARSPDNNAAAPAGSAAPAVPTPDGAALMRSSVGGAVVTSMAKGFMSSLGFGKSNVRRSAGVAPMAIPAPIVEPQNEGARGGGLEAKFGLTLSYNLGRILSNSNLTQV